MDVIEALQSRNSTRAYTAEPVDREMVLKILEAANKAPSWANTQPWEIFVATGAPLERLRRRCVESFRDGAPYNPDQPFPREWPEAHRNRTAVMAAAHLNLLGIAREDKAARQKMIERGIGFFGAPAVIFLCMDRTLTPWSMFDLGAMAQSIMLAAQHYNLNTVPAVITVVYPDLIREELNIPGELAVIIGIALGYGDANSIENRHITTRRPLEEFVRMAGF